MIAVSLEMSDEPKELVQKPMAFLLALHEKKVLVNSMNLPNHLIYYSPYLLLRGWLLRTYYCPISRTFSIMNVDHLSFDKPTAHHRRADG